MRLNRATALGTTRSTLRFAETNFRRMVPRAMRFFVFVTLFSIAVLARGAEPAAVASVRPTDSSAETSAKGNPFVALLPGTPPLLAEAIRKSALDGERWAYTQTTISRDRDGQVKEETIVRYDPSLPYEEQWTPLKQDGKAPTERQIKNLRAEHEKRRKNRRALGELLDLAQASVVEETATTVTYEVPLSKNDNQRLPPDKFRVTARVNKERQEFEHVGVRLRAALRMKLIFKLKSGEADLDFARVCASHQ